MDKTGIALVAIAIIVFFLPVGPMVKLILGVGALLIGVTMIIRALKAKE